jgi:hypothetical protein
MINLQDAIERAKLAADESGLLSIYAYDRILEQLAEKDQYPFTMALVDLGIITKHGNVEAMNKMEEVLAADERVEYEDEDENDLDVVKVGSDLVSTFVKISESYVQSPAGLWVPDTGSEEEDEKPSGAYESFLEKTPFVDPSQTPEEEIDIPPESLPDDMFMGQQLTPEYVQGVLEDAGLSVDANGNVSRYQSTVPGLYTKKNPFKAVPLAKTIAMLNSEVASVDKEQERIADLQGILGSLSSDFTGMEEDLQDLLERFSTTMDGLSKFKYSENSTDENIREIANGLSNISEYMGKVGPFVDDFRSGIGQYDKIIEDLKGRLDNYYQKQYDQYDVKLETIDVLEKLNKMLEKDPDKFKEMVSGTGGISMAAKFKRSQKGN